MVKHNNQWGTVCDDGLESAGEIADRVAHSACYTLGLSGGLIQPKHNHSPETYLLDEVRCASNTTYFLECSHDNWGKHDCGRNYVEHVLLTCT